MCSFVQDIARRMRNGEYDKVGLDDFEDLSAVRKSAYVAAQCLLETDAPLLFAPSLVQCTGARKSLFSLFSRYIGTGGCAIWVQEQQETTGGLSEERRSSLTPLIICRHSVASPCADAINGRAF